MKIIAYIRTSTKDQLSAYGPARQREAIAEWAQRNGHRVIDEIVEDVSGTIAPFERKAWIGIVQRCCDGETGGVVVSDLSRLSRDQVRLELTLEQMAGCEAKLFSTSGEEQSMLDNPDDPQRKLIRTILAAVNEYDRAQIVSRVQAGRRIKKASGGYAGGQPPFGYRGGDGSKELVLDPHEQRVLGRMRELSGAGYSTRTIATMLTDEGLRTRRDGAWSSPMVSKYLRATT